MSISVHSVHEYNRNPKNHNIYRCIHPRCHHYQRREYLVGKEAICSKCKQLFILDSDQLRNAKPRCEMCQNTHKGRAFRTTLKQLAAAIEAEQVSIESPTSLETDPNFKPLTLLDSNLREERKLGE